MTDDPKRWIEDDEAPRELRAYLKHAAAPEGTLPVALRAQIRQALLEVCEENARDLTTRDLTTRDLTTRDRNDGGVAEPALLSPRRTGMRTAVFAMLAAAVILLGVVRYGSEPRVDPPTPAVAPEPIDAGPDAPGIEVIEVERVCGEREDSDHQCDLVVRLSHGYERIELHAASGIRPPTCDGAPEQHRESAEGELRFVLSDGASERGLRAFTVCGYQGGVLLGAGSVEGQRNLPHLALSRRRGGDDVRIPLEAIDEDITHLELRWVPEEDHWSSVLDGCPGETVASLSRDEFAPMVGREGVSFFRHVAIPEERMPTFVLCGISDAGAHHVRMPYRFPEYEQPFVQTTSGELPLDQLAGSFAALGPDGLVTISYLSASWPGSAVNRRTSERLLALMDEASAPPPRELVLANGQVLLLPRGATLGPGRAGDMPRVATLRDGTSSAVVSERPLGPVMPGDGDPLRIARQAVLTSTSEASIYLDDVVIALFPTGDEAATPRDAEPDEPIRVMPQVAYECHVEVLLELESLPPDLEGVAVAFVRHARDVDLDAQPAIDCATASLAIELPASGIAALPTDARGVRRLGLTFSDAPNDFNDLEDDAYCVAPYAVIACVRDAGGLHALPGAIGRWTHSGMACFAGDTPVATDDGAVPIASLHAGDRVLAFDPQRGDVVATTVTRLIPRGVRAVLAITLSNGSTLRVTPEHPLFDRASGVFRRAQTFEIGDRLRGLDGNDVRVMGIANRSEPTAVFDLSVAGPHTYFAGGIVAHNY